MRLSLEHLRHLLPPALQQTLATSKESTAKGKEHKASEEATAT